MDRVKTWIVYVTYLFAQKDFTNYGKMSRFTIFEALVSLSTINAHEA
jgi:hypothetical protein